jgi:hypothetical protein
VKNAVPQRVETQVLNSVGGVDATEHVVPLQKLVQNDAIEESPQT